MERIARCAYTRDYCPNMLGCKFDKKKLPINLSGIPESEWSVKCLTFFFEHVNFRVEPSIAYLRVISMSIAYIIMIIGKHDEAQRLKLVYFHFQTLSNITS